MRQRKKRPHDLREACVEQALAIVRDEGLEKLSLREVARRLGVSHGAPYKHFGSRDHILAEVVARAFADFAAHLDARPRTGRPHDDLAEMGRAYLSYALAQPLNYRLMFSTTLPDPDTHPCMMREARHAFALLRDGLRAVHAAERRVASEDSLNLDAMFVWATMHGLAGVMIGDSIRQIGLPARVLSQMQPHVLGCISAALDLPAPSTS